ncbi:MAG: M1 family aminopeptidase, partial [Thermomicrobiales bacterium]
PYDELDIVQTELAGALGVSWSGLLFMDAQRMQDGLPTVAMPSSILAFALVHEIAHQWWGVKVGVNSNDHAFMNESLANYLTIATWGVIFDESTAYEALVQQIAGPYLAFLEGNPDGVVDRAISEVASMSEFGRLVYGKGGLGLHAIRLAIGDAAFFTALERYATEHSFLVASPGDLLNAFETASGSDLNALWNLWFNAATTTPSDVQELLTSSSS